jgi:alpha-tubulin suppressor-like RCC1 family protein
MTGERREQIWVREVALPPTFDLAVGARFACALDGAGSLRCFGDAATVGRGAASMMRNEGPGFPNGLPRVVGVSATEEKAAAWDARGRLWFWGFHALEHTGQTSDLYHLEPVRMPRIRGATGAAMGLTHACALQRNGRVRCWGSNRFGQLGDGTTQHSTDLPVQVRDLPLARAIDAGGSLSCALTRDRRVYCWGQRRWAPGGPLPAPVEGITHAVDLSVGWTHACAVVDAGTVYCWGDNDEGQLGRGDLGGSGEPAPAVGLSDIIAIDSAGRQTCALRSDGTVHCWGQYLPSPHTYISSRVPLRAL